MKTIILCGGYGTRLSEETKIKPKPMVKIGSQPILKHITNIFEHYKFDEFILALGYKSNYIKKFYSKNKNNKIQLVYTGKETMTGGRLLRLKKFFNKGDTFMLTYGDGLTSQNIKNLVKFHKSHRKIATVTAVRPPVRFGELEIKGNKVSSFREKTQIRSSWINGGYFVFNYEIFNFIKNDKTMLEKEPLEKLTKIGELIAYKHEGFWQCMDTLRDKNLLNKLWKGNKTPWKK
jgi:glucose-1-phosphate cytidylyltransferase